VFRNYESLNLLETYGPVRAYNGIEKFVFNTFSTIKSLKKKSKLFYIKIQFVPSRTHFISAINTQQLMFYRAKVVVCSEINTKHPNAVWAERTIFAC